MRFIAGLCLAALCALAALPAAAGQGTYPQTEEGLQDEEAADDQKGHRGHAGVLLEAVGFHRVRF